MDRQEINHYISNLSKVSDRTLARLGELAINGELMQSETLTVYIETTERFIKLTQELSQL